MKRRGRAARTTIGLLLGAALCASGWQPVPTLAAGPSREALRPQASPHQLVLSREGDRSGTGLAAADRSRGLDRADAAPGTLPRLTASLATRPLAVPIRESSGGIPATRCDRPAAPRGPPVHPLSV